MADAILAQSGIYAITNKTNGKMYVGGTVNFGKRWALHRWSMAKGRHENRRLQRDFARYGADAFEFSVLECVENSCDLISREQHWLDTTRAVEVGYNICSVAGSRLGVKMTAESRALMSASAAGKIISAEHRASLSAAMIGYKHTPEHNEKCRIARTGMKIPKISAALMGRKRSAEAIEKQRASLTGRKQPADEIARRIATMTGQKRSDKARENMSAAQKGRAVSSATREKLRAANLAISPERRAEITEKRRLARECRAAGLLTDQISAVA